jgi:glyoxylase-like metal-dependent hydrolase (beta-lactamase superfamily II)
MFDYAGAICNARGLTEEADMVEWIVGDVRISRIQELTTASLGPHLLPQATAEALAPLPWLRPFLDDRSRLVLSIHAFIVRTREATLIVDTCIGNDKVRTYPRWNRMQGDFLERLRAAGHHEDSIDTVLCTHMHVDHVGWNTRLIDGRWQPTFANARYLFAKSEWAHWRVEEQEYGPVIEDSVKPVFDAGLADLVDEDCEVSREIRLEPTPGHTPGHVSVHITSRGEEAVITGDMIHHPCQIAHPHWSSTADVDPDCAAVTRAHFLARYADRPVLVLGTHFAGPTAGRVVRDGDAFRLDL